MLWCWNKAVQAEKPHDRKLWRDNHIPPSQAQSSTLIDSFTQNIFLNRRIRRVRAGLGVGKDRGGAGGKDWRAEVQRLLGEGQGGWEAGGWEAEEGGAQAFFLVSKTSRTPAVAWRARERYKWN